MEQLKGKREKTGEAVASVRIWGYRVFEISKLEEERV